MLFPSAQPQTAQTARAQPQTARACSSLDQPAAVLGDVRTVALESKIIGVANENSIKSYIKEPNTCKHEGQISNEPNPDQCELNVYEDDAEAMAAGKASGRAANARGRVGRHTGARPHI